LTRWGHGRRQAAQHQSGRHRAGQQTPHALRRYQLPGQIPRSRVLGDLAQNQCITTTELRPWTFQTGHQKRTLRVAGRLIFNSFESSHDACMAGIGIALLSSWYTAEYLQSGSLVAIALEDAQPKELAVWAVYPTRRLVLPKVRMFVEAMRGVLG